MKYGALAVGMTDELLSHLQIQLAPHDLHFEAVLTVPEAKGKLSKKSFHILIANLEYLQSMGQVTWISDIRHTNLFPVIVLSADPERDTRSVVQLGADICVSDKYSGSVIADLVFAQLRRYTEYNNHHAPDCAENAPFQVGDIFIDPVRRIVEVCGKSVSLRPREFSLLLYFMHNHNIVLTANQICEHAWGMEYTQPVGQSVHELRKRIESVSHSCRIRTVYRVGYRFVSDFAETCDD